MPHLPIAGKLHPAGLAVVEAAPGWTSDPVEKVSKESHAPPVDHADALVIRTQPRSATAIAKASRPCIVSRQGVGPDAMDLPALPARGIPLTVVGDVNSALGAEHATMRLLAMAKRALRADRAVRGGDWGRRNRPGPREVAGRNLLILGFGRTGRHLARMTAGFGMEVRAYDPCRTPTQ